MSMPQRLVIVMVGILSSICGNAMYVLCLCFISPLKVIKSILSKYITIDGFRSPSIAHTWARIVHSHHIRLTNNYFEKAGATGLFYYSYSFSLLNLVLL